MWLLAMQALITFLVAAASVDDGRHVLSVETAGQLSDWGTLYDNAVESEIELEESLTNSNPVNAFGVKLLNEWRKENPTESVVFSPLTLAAAFLLVYKGANGQTRDEMAELFGFKDTSVVDGLLAKVEAYSEGSIAQLANRVYLEKELNVLETYLDSVGRENIVSVDFKNRSRKVTKEINKWVKRKTSGLIPQLLSPGDLDQDTRLLAVNALYFEGKWKHRFPKQATKTDVFHGVDEDENVPFMHLSSEEFPYTAVPELEGVLFALPYKGNQFSMVIFLPDEADGWKKAENELGKIYEMVPEMWIEDIRTLKMPKWEMEATLVNLDGEDGILSRLGMPTAFSDFADFSNIAEDVSISISKVVHKAKIIVDEQSTEAAAVTGVVSMEVMGIMSLAPPIVIIVDRPFVYFILDKSDGTVLFQGTQTSIKNG